MQLTLQDARRLALSRQRLDKWEIPSAIDPTVMLNLFRRLGCVQLDPIRHVERTHLLVLWSRLGPFDPTILDQLRFQDRAVFEYWAHAASLVLTEEWPVYEWQMRRARARVKEGQWFEKHRELFVPLLAEIMQQLRAGPKLSKELLIDDAGLRLNSRWWSGRYTGRLLDLLWTRGEVMVHGRTDQNHRLWGLAETFWPDWTPREQWADRQLTRFAAQKAVRALGVATARQIKQHYTRNRYPKLMAVLQALCHEQVLVPVTIIAAEGPLPDQWYVHQADIPLLNQIQSGQWQGRTTLLSPFDNLICDRDRMELLFDFHYRVEIYVPRQKRKFGYYVLPILHHDQLIGRVDATMDRQTNRLHMNNVYAEANAPVGRSTADAIMEAAEGLGQFLGAEKVVWGNMPDIWV